MEPMNDAGHEARRVAIRQLIRTRWVGTQEELREALREKGFEVTQATLSRDLARLRARKTSLPEGGSAYELEGFQAPEEPEELARFAEMVTGVDENGSLVVVLTLVGAASAVALALDRARLPEVLGTIAGDDTIFIAPARKTSTAALAKRLKKTWRKGGT
jgi:transcriptional regulator of arginine metabolism